MTDREKLYELIDSVDIMNIPTENFRHSLADYLISNGVTIREQGEWIEAHDNDGMDYECSNQKCRCRISYNGSRVSGDFNYCPNCGADMRKEKENE